MRSAFVYQIDSYLKQNGKYTQKREQDHLSGRRGLPGAGDPPSFSTQTSYENQTKKAITNKFIQEAMTEFLRHQLEIYFIENPDWMPDKSAEQVLINKRSRENAEKTRLNLKKKLHRQHGPCQPGAEVCGLPQQGRRPSGRSTSWRATRRWAPAS